MNWNRRWQEYQVERMTGQGRVVEEVPDAQPNVGERAGLDAQMEKIWLAAFLPLRGMLERRRDQFRGTKETKRLEAAIEKEQRAVLDGSGSLEEFARLCEQWREAAEKGGRAGGQEPGPA